MMGPARLALARVPGLAFWKLCGSGAGEGFDITPNSKVFALLTTWPDAETARRQTQTASIFQRYAQRATETWSVFLETTSVRGKWSGVEPFGHANGAQAQQPKGPIATLTRATIKPSVLMRFWGRVPDISAVIGSDPNVIFKIGIGEVPLLHQVTFSIWPDAQSMAAFARRDGPHARAIRAVRDGLWFREELYARFTISGERGTWGGTSPLSVPDLTP